MEEGVEIFANNLKEGKIGIIPTDTIYGISSSAFSREAVERIYATKKRNSEKPLIVLVSKMSDLELFGISLSDEKMKAVKKYWPGKVSLILPCFSPDFFYLHRGKEALAFRLPKEDFLIEFIEKTGPIVSTSANLEGEPQATNVRMAKGYFGSGVDFYWDKGELSGLASKIVDLTGDKERIIRD